MTPRDKHLFFFLCKIKKSRSCSAVFPEGGGKLWGTDEATPCSECTAAAAECVSVLLFYDYFNGPVFRCDFLMCIRAHACANTTSGRVCRSVFIMQVRWDASSFQPPPPHPPAIYPPPPLLPNSRDDRFPPKADCIAMATGSLSLSPSPSISHTRRPL